jgi:hypothetical protein
MRTFVFRGCHCGGESLAQLLLLVALQSTSIRDCHQHPCVQQTQCADSQGMYILATTLHGALRSTESRCLVVAQGGPLDHVRTVMVRTR